MNIIKELKELGSPTKARAVARFFKTGKDQYGEGDMFFGVTVPETRAIAEKYLTLSFKEIQRLLNNKIHEVRLAGLLILVGRYKQADTKERETLFQFYLKNTSRVNNWDLVDLTADKIVGQHLLDKNIDPLHKLARSPNIWERRIAIIATFQFIKDNRFNETIELSEHLLHDKHDLMHKAVGWMLREMGKRDERLLHDFLKKHYKIMPRTTLRYAIERIDETSKEKYMGRSHHRKARI